MWRSWKFSRAWRDKTRDLKPFAPVEVSSGPITENFSKATVSILRIFPTPKWHEHDGGRYIGTGDMVITKDPDSGWINVGTYRSCVVAKDRVTLWIIEHKHGKQIARKILASGTHPVPSPSCSAASPLPGWLRRPPPKPA